MKKRILKTVEVNLEEVAQEIIDEYPTYEFAGAIKGNYIDNYITDCIDDYLDLKEAKISDSEKETLKNLVISKVTTKIEILKKRELETFSDREKILELLENWLYESNAYYDYETLSTSEILDEIIKNGNK